MSAKPIMEFEIIIDRSVSYLIEKPGARAKIIPFTGSVKSDLFTGTILPGGTDVQITDGAGAKHMCANYMFEGVDYTGAACHLFVQNNGYFEVTHVNGTPFNACPTFITDSKALAPYLEAPHFRSEGHPNKQGVTIKIFDLQKQEEE